MHAAVNALREKEPKKIVVAIPVCAPETCRQMQNFADEVVWLFAPEWFHGVGQFYDDFSQTSDEEVRRLACGCSVKIVAAFLRTVRLSRGTAESHLYL